MAEAVAPEALAEGLEGDALRRTGERIDVRQGPIGRCFSVADEPVAGAFGRVAGAEPGTLILSVRAEDAAVEHLTHSFALATGSRYDALGRPWINARRLSRYGAGGGHGRTRTRSGRRHCALCWKRPAHRTVALFATH